MAVHRGCLVVKGKVRQRPYAAKFEAAQVMWAVGGEARSPAVLGRSDHDEA